jgi:hypothetical protein
VGVTNDGRTHVGLVLEMRDGCCLDVGLDRVCFCSDGEGSKKGILKDVELLSRPQSEVG